MIMLQNGRSVYAWACLASLLLVQSAKVCPALAADAPELYKYEIVAEYVHDSAAFTQGLVHDLDCPEDGSNCTDIFYESTGMNGESSVRRVELSTGSVLQATQLAHTWFGEGLAMLNRSLYQLTWQTAQGFTYSADTLGQTGTFTTPLSDGWGITTDGGQFVVSDGSNKLVWVDPADWSHIQRTITVTDGGRTIGWLNELELVEGEVWANVWQTECIARIDPQTGAVKGWVLMHGIRAAMHHRRQHLAKGHMDVLNGIAYDPKTKRLWVTGKYWPTLFEIQVVPINPHTKEAKAKRSSCHVRP